MSLFGLVHTDRGSEVVWIVVIMDSTNDERGKIPVLDHHSTELRMVDPEDLGLRLHPVDSALFVRAVQELAHLRVEEPVEVPAGADDLLHQAR